MKVSTIIRTVITAALAATIVPAAIAQTAKPTVGRTIVVRDGQVIGGEGRPLRMLLADRGYLGVHLIDLTPELREHFRVQKDAGVLVGKVLADSPAAKAGIRVGDIITSVDGTPVDSATDIARAVRDKKKGENVRIDYSRDGANGTAVASVAEHERREVDLRDLDIDIPEIRIPDVGRHMQEYFNSPEWKAKVERLQRLPDCGDMQRKLDQLDQKMKDLEKRLSKK